MGKEQTNEKKYNARKYAICTREKYADATCFMESQQLNVNI